jgi:hypothetical protein
MGDGTHAETTHPMEMEEIRSLSRTSSQPPAFMNTISEGSIFLWRWGV